MTDLLYLGCYTPATGGVGAGVSVVDRDPRTGALSAARVVAETPSPSFLARHPRLPVLYAVHEVDEGALSGWAVGPDGALRPLRTRATGGGQPCHVAVHPAGGHAFAPGTGPRHVARDRAGRRYVVGELDASVAAYDIDAAGPSRERARVPASTQAGPTLPSEVAVSADDRFLYVANRGPDTIAVFALDDGRPRYVTEVPTGGEWPRHFTRIDEWLYVANQRSHSVVTLRIDRASGVPAATGARLETPSPTCILPSGRD